MVMFTCSNLPMTVLVVIVVQAIYCCYASTTNIYEDLIPSFKAGLKRQGKSEAEISLVTQSFMGHEPSKTALTKQLYPYSDVDKNIRRLSKLVFKNHYHTILSLLAVGADGNMKLEDGLTMLHISIINEDVFLLNLLLKRAKVDPMIADSTGNTALHFCSCCCRFEMMVHLVTKVDKDCVNIVGETALHAAVREYQFNIIKLLVTNGCSLDVKNKEGQTALDLAKTFTDIDVNVQMRSIIEYLESKL